MPQTTFWTLRRVGGGSRQCHYRNLCLQHALRRRRGQQALPPWDIGGSSRRCLYRYRALAASAVQALRGARVATNNLGTVGEGRGCCRYRYQCLQQVLCKCERQQALSHLQQVLRKCGGQQVLPQTTLGQLGEAAGAATIANSACSMCRTGVEGSRRCHKQPWDSWGYSRRCYYCCQCLMQVLLRCGGQQVLPRTTLE